MTQEQYNRAVGLNKKISRLSDLKQNIGEKGYKLAYTKKWFEGHIFNIRYFAYGDDIIPDILDRHDKMIREEIDAEIKKLKKEIEEI